MNDSAVRVPQILQIAIREEADVPIARKCVHQLAPEGGLSHAGAYALATAVSEIARNIVVHAGDGTLTVRVDVVRDRRGLIVIAQDSGPGIPDVSRAMRDGYSTAGSLGLGLSSAQRLVDDFEVVSEVNRGTIVTLRMWAQ